jgi:hypothetical protein
MWNIWGAQNINTMDEIIQLDRESLPSDGRFVVADF